MEADESAHPGHYHSVGADGYRPFPFSGLVLYGHKGGYAREVQENEQHKRDGGGKADRT